MNHSQRSAILQEALIQDPAHNPHHVSASVLADMIVEYAMTFPGTHRAAYETLRDAILQVIDSLRDKNGNGKRSSIEEGKT